ncbi:GNAT family N-acetyltransferase [Paenibacillus massiliensis]|nr:GNAT family N-acetyltransferase [Paenibacillus massiliensis]
MFRCNHDRTNLQRLLEFRYKVYVKELKYLEGKSEFQLLGMEFDEYDLYSDHIMIEQDDEIVACARIIQYSELGLPVLSKLNYSYNNELRITDAVEVSRLIVKSEHRVSLVFMHLLQAIFKQLLLSDCQSVFADTFVDSDSYKLMLSLGFKKAGWEYNDSCFKLDAQSSVLYFQMDEMKEMLCNRPNRRQQAFLKNLKQPIS